MSFSSGGSKSSSYQSTKEGLAYLNKAREQLGMITPEIIQQTLQQRLDNLSGLMGNLSSMAQMQAQKDMGRLIPGASNSAGTQALLSVAPQVAQLQDAVYAQAGQQQMGLQELMARLAAQYAGLTGYSKGKSTNPGIGYNIAGNIAQGLGTGLGYTLGKM